MYPLEKMSVTSTNVLTVTLDLRVKILSNMDDFSQKCPEWMQLHVKKSSLRFNKQNMSKMANTLDLTVTLDLRMKELSYMDDFSQNCSE